MFISLSNFLTKFYELRISPVPPYDGRCANIDSVLDYGIFKKRWKNAPSGRQDLPGVHSADSDFSNSYDYGHSRTEGLCRSFGVRLPICNDFHCSMGCPSFFSL